MLKTITQTLQTWTKIFFSLKSIKPKLMVFKINYVTYPLILLKMSVKERVWRFVKKVLPITVLVFSSPLWARDLQEIVSSGKLIVGVCQIDQPPFYERTKNGLKGHDINLAKGLAETLGVKLIINEQAKNWDDLVVQLEKKEVDLAISFLSETATRSKTILYSNPYSKIHQAILVNRLKLSQAHAEGKKTLNDIFSKHSDEGLLVYQGSSYIKFAKTLFHNDVKLMEFKTQEEIMEALLSGKQIGFICDQLEIKNYMKDHPDAKIKLLPLTLKNSFDLISVGMGYQNYALQNFVNIFLQTHSFFIDVNEPNSNFYPQADVEEVF